MITKYNGTITLTQIIGNKYNPKTIKQRYIGYTEKQALKLFKQEILKSKGE